MPHPAVMLGLSIRRTKLGTLAMFALRALVITSLVLTIPSTCAAPIPLGGATDVSPSQNPTSHTATVLPNSNVPSSTATGTFTSKFPYSYSQLKNASTGFLSKIKQTAKKPFTFPPDKPAEWKCPGPSQLKRQVRKNLKDFGSSFGLLLPSPDATDKMIDVVARKYNTIWLGGIYSRAGYLLMMMDSCGTRSQVLETALTIAAKFAPGDKIFIVEPEDKMQKVTGRLDWMFPVDETVKILLASNSRLSIVKLVMSSKNEVVDQISLH